MMKAFSNAINPGEKLRLRDDVLPLLQRRSWTFTGTGKGGRILLGHGYVWEAKPDSIDWEEFQRRKGLDEFSVFPWKAGILLLKLLDEEIWISFPGGWVAINFLVRNEWACGFENIQRCLPTKLSGGVMTTKKILFVASLVLIPFLVRFARRKNEDEERRQIAIWGQIVQ